MPDQLYYAKRHDKFVQATHSQVPSFTQLNAQDFCHKELPKLGTGKGVKVVLLDTGVADHNYLKTTINGANLGPSETSFDFNGHAYAAAGIISANDPGAMIGLAPESFMCYAKVTNEEGCATSIAVSAALLWAVAIGAHVAVLSAIPTVQTELFVAAVNKAVANNVLVVMDGTVDSVILPSGVVSTAGMKFPEKLLTSTFIENTFVSIDASDFSPAIAGGIAALLYERAKAADKKSKASTMAKQISSLIKG